MPWNARLQLDYRLEGARTVARHRHEGPLRILQSLYPEGDAVCHNVLVHPPGGLVGGDRLDIDVHVAEGAHGMIGTPGATRYYRSTGEPAVQQVKLTLAPGSRLEWTPLETIAFDGCQAENRMDWRIAPGAQLLAWDVCAFGLPAADAPFLRGRYLQRIDWPGVWLEQARFDATDRLLMDSPAGMAGQRCLALMVWACGEPIERAARERMLEALRAVPPADGARHGITSPNPRIVVARVLAPVVEPAMQLLRALWACARREAWGIGTTAPRIWNV